jgi:hypothetical protein
MRISTLVVCTLAIVSLTGCGIVQQQRAQQAALERQEMFKAAGAEFTAAAQSCQKRRITGELHDYVASVKCSNPTLTAAYAKAGFPYMDLIYLLGAARLAGAEKIDKKELSEGEFQVQLSELMTRITNEARRRDLEVVAAHNQAIAAQAAQSQASAAQTQSTGALLLGLGAFQSANQPPQPAGFTCTRFGNTTTCR